MTAYLRLFFFLFQNMQPGTSHFASFLLPFHHGDLMSLNFWTQRGNSFWRTSRLRESHAAIISLREALLVGKGKRVSKLKLSCRRSLCSHADKASELDIPKRNSQVLPRIVSFWIHGNRPYIVSNRIFIQTLHREQLRKRPSQEEL